MTNARILNLAMHQLLTVREAEEARIMASPEPNTIRVARLAKLDAEIKELHSMILEAERTPA